MNIKNNKPFSEIIESSLQEFTAQCWEWDDFPAFGQLITVQSGTQTIFGLVHQVKTGSMDPVRYPFPYKKTEKELLKEQPQIFEFLKTTMSCITLGYMQYGKIFYLLAPKPPKIHAFACHADKLLSKQFFSKFEYLHLLFGNSGQIFNIDELLLALIQQQTELGIMGKEKIEKFIEKFSLLTGNDYRRLKLFLQRVSSIQTFYK